MLPSGSLDRLIAARRRGDDRARRDGAGVAIWVAAERLPELLAVHPDAPLDAGDRRAAVARARVWTRDEAIVELLRGRLTIAGPTTAARARRVAVDRPRRTRTRRCSRSSPKASCCADRFTARLADRRSSGATARLLARIHRYTLNRLRAEIEPVSPADFMRFLFAWQHVDAGEPADRRRRAARGRSPRSTASSWPAGGVGTRGAAGARRRLRAVDARHAVPDRRGRLGAAVDPVAGRSRGDRGWAARRRSRCSCASTADAWHDARDRRRRRTRDTGARPISARAAGAGRRCARAARRSSASSPPRVPGRRATSASALGELVAAGLVTSDGFAGLRAIVRAVGRPRRPPRDGRRRSAGRWSLLGARRRRHAARARRSRLRRGRCCGATASSSGGCWRARRTPRRGASWRASTAGSKRAARSAAAASSPACRASSSRCRTR